MRGFGAEVEPNLSKDTRRGTTSAETIGTIVLSNDLQPISTFLMI
jgi:hypothetical protein